ncbi:hypothetical protein B0T26DRAFT_643192 [Lasiosphaeria miniovina]|uniref:Uncharacterized protein n=1 Tax=Lasiosphaeria miniovina TaxID=1954250 RepID=A0AA40E0N6_9PEZI|nr:uncharacterized protein B0T26DRAFT_643192 [Lasiosphaeria miniovina]KAK0723589.1 hypothetical protein B0T26DRAFT_643192 [Lasiosphaeria miniovina]
MGVAAVAVEKRLPRLGQFGVSLTRACPLQTPLDVFEFAEGEQSDACRTFLNNNVYRAIDVFFWDPQCLLTLFETNNCTDPGVVTGPNCWTPDGGIAAYKVTCPYKTS